MVLCTILVLLSVNLDLAYIGKCYLNASYNCKIPLYETSSSSDIKTYVVNWYYTDDSPNLYVKKIKNGRALIDAIYPEWGQKYHKDETGWIDTKYICTYLVDDCKSVDLLDCYEEGNVVYTIGDSDSSLPYHVVAVWKIGWVKISVPGTDIEGWLDPKYRSESPSFMLH